MNAYAMSRATAWKTLEERGGVYWYKSFRKPTGF